MALKHQKKALYSTEYTQDVLEKLNHIVSKVKSLTHNHVFQQKILEISNHLLKRERVLKEEWYSQETLEDLFNNLEDDQTEDDDVNRLKRVQ